MSKKILFVSHVKAQCGVYEYGKSITDVIQRSTKYEFIRIECSSLAELESAVKKQLPDAIIYNYYPSVVPWVATQKRHHWWVNHIASIQVPQIGIIHEITQEVADTATNYRSIIAKTNVSSLSRSLFDYYIAPDPTLFLRNPFVYKTGRLIPRYKNEYPVPPTPVIGSFGFATPKKGFEKVVQLVQAEYDEAMIRFNIPAADFGEDKEGHGARSLAQKCKSLIVKPGIQLIVTHDFFDTKSMLDFLAKNSINVFLYEHDATSGKGISSAIDNAMAVQRPIAISEAVMFRHIVDATPSICISKSNLKTIIKNGFTPLKKHYNEWNEENLLWEYERILDSIFRKEIDKELQPWNPVTIVQRKVKGILNKPDSSIHWLRDSADIAHDDMTVDAAQQYQPIIIPERISLNRILDDKNRLIYGPTIQKLTELVPKTMAKKIPKANVQQAFVFDTVYRYQSKIKDPKILCVGSYEDTAAMSLKKMGIQIEEIDPTYNYSLQEYSTKPSTILHSYDIIFSTSVIEHDPDDESFVKCIADLLAHDGIAIMTCDYKDDWKPGDPLPDCNERFYTQVDLKNRLLPLMSHCHLLDEPQWDCPNPDFNYLGKYQYTFATMVVQKRETIKEGVRMESKSHLKLSICIPTYNFGKFIGATLDSIIPNLREDVEVVILDGGSTDDTALVIAQRQQHYPQIKYFPQAKRGGIDRDIAKVVTLAQGDYCWLFSADDIMMSGAAEKVLRAMESKSDIYLCEHILCDYDMNPITEYLVFNTITAPEIFNLGDLRNRKRYFREARTSEAFFSFLSGPIFKRELWDKSNGIPESFYETCWALAGRLLSLVPNGLTIHYLGKRLIYKRGGNDSFLEHGVVHRLRISVEGFTHIAETIFGKSSFETYHIRRVIRNERPLGQLIMIKLYTHKNEMPLLNRLVFMHYSHAGMISLCKYLLFRFLPLSFLKFLRLIKRTVMRRSVVAKKQSIRTE